ncbi:hypothetical protein QQF64_023384, partial [Cirrhinus molitorella]
MSQSAVYSRARHRVLSYSVLGRNASRCARAPRCQSARRRAAERERLLKVNGRHGRIR